MMQFPASTKIGRILSKEAICSHLGFKTKERDLLTADIQRVTIAHSFKTESLPLADGRTVHEILLLDVDLKNGDFNRTLFTVMAKKNPHHLLFRFQSDGKIILALYEQNWHQTEWLPEETAELEVKGPSLDELWNGFVTQIASLESVQGETIVEKLENKSKIEHLQKKIDQLTKKIARELQPVRKFDLHKERQELIRQLERMK